MNNVTISQLSRLIGITMVLYGVVSIIIEYIRHSIYSNRFAEMYSSLEGAAHEQNTFFYIANYLEFSAVIITGILLFVFSRVIQKILE